MRIWLARLLIGLVIAWNLQAALAFFISPETFVSGFELNSTPGTTAIRGFAVLFVMWNVPYLVAFWQPIRHLTSLKEALVMQTIGLSGETAILFSLPTGHTLLHSSILRFILFDSTGLVFLILVFFLIKSPKQNLKPQA
jgi:hypothetical protein